MSKGGSSAGPNVFSIDAGDDFLGQLARGLAEQFGLNEDPEALVDALIYVPNRRSARALAFSLFTASDRKACLLPDIRALGDLESEEPPPSAETALADLPPALSPSRRIGGLTQLVMRYYSANGVAIPPAGALAAARELASLLDQAALSGEVAWDRLESLVEDRQLARHWDQSVDFLKIITQQWPAKLDDATAMDPYTRRLAAAEAIVSSWAKSPPSGPVIIAGSTGATPASRLLMRAALDLPQGRVVLPGLDRDVGAEMWTEIGRTPSHPQFTLARTLEGLGLSPEAVQSWQGTGEVGRGAALARRRLIHEALAPARNTADWTERLVELAPDGNAARFVQDAVSGLTLIEASDDHDEAMLAALQLRAVLETPDQTAALVTPDAGLARHVSALLRQWNVEVPPSAGLPLGQTAAGSLALLAANWSLDPGDPVRLVALLNHVDCDISDADTRTLDLCLRGQRTWPDLQGLREHVRLKLGADRDQLIDVIDRLMALVPAGSEPDAPISGADWFAGLCDLTTALCRPPRPWSGEDGAALANLIRACSELTEDMLPQRAEVWAEILQAEMQRVATPSGTAHPRLAIWGPLEARLQRADRIILAGLNEGIWPAQPPADSFLPRVFRAEIGLADPDERIGLSAHDFAQLAAAPNTVLLYSQRRDDKPAVASRWIWRLRTLVRGALGEAAIDALAPASEADPRAWLKHLECAPSLPKGFSAEPRPTPPLTARPQGLSVTRIEQLVRDPYAIYGQYVLKLRRLDPLNAPSDARVRGSAIHLALEQFEDLGHAQQTAKALLELVETQLRASGEREADLIALRDRRSEVCEAYLTWRETQAAEIGPLVLTEEKGSIDLMIAGRPFRLSGTADRIETRHDGTVAILDFKSGAPPSERQVRSGLSPQMPLQGLIARDGGYPRLGKAEVSALTYVRFGTQFSISEIGSGSSRTNLDDIAVADLIKQAEAGLHALLTKFADPRHPYLSAPRPERVTYESDYTRLARRAEWAGLDAYD